MIIIKVIVMMLIVCLICSKCELMKVSGVRIVSNVFMWVFFYLFFII